VTLYEHTDGDHAFRIVFDPALALDAAPRPPSRYEMSLDGFARLVSGVAPVRASVPNGVTITLPGACRGARPSPEGDEPPS